PKVYLIKNNRDEGDVSAHIMEIEHFLATANAGKLSVEKGRPASSHADVHIADVEYFMFDPNGLAVVDWKRLGLSDRQIRMIKNYEAKGGRFRKKEDLKKIYAISDADYARLSACIAIAVIDSPDPASLNRVSEG